MRSAEPCTPPKLLLQNTILSNEKGTGCWTNCQMFWLKVLYSRWSYKDGLQIATYTWEHPAMRNIQNLSHQRSVFNFFPLQNDTRTFTTKQLSKFHIKKDLKEINAISLQGFQSFPFTSMFLSPENDPSGWPLDLPTRSRNAPNFLMTLFSKRESQFSKWKLNLHSCIEIFIGFNLSLYFLFFHRNERLAGGFWW